MSKALAYQSIIIFQPSHCQTLVNILPAYLEPQLVNYFRINRLVKLSAK